MRFCFHPRADNEFDEAVRPKTPTGRLVIVKLIGTLRQNFIERFTLCQCLTNTFHGVEKYLAGILLVDSGQDLDQRRLARPVLTD